MTTEVRPEVEMLAVLRPAQLDERDTAIVLAVAKRWADYGLGSSYRSLGTELRLRPENIHWRIRGYKVENAKPSCKRYRAGGGLIERGWIVQADANCTIRPGPRFGGMQRGRGVIYERVPADK